MRSIFGLLVSYGPLALSPARKAVALPELHKDDCSELCDAFSGL